MSASTSPLEVALSYARRGWEVFPLHPVRDGACGCSSPKCEAAGKHPATDHGFKDASRDEAVLRAWWTDAPLAGVGIATGAASGLVVLDVDPRHGGDDSIVALREEHGELPRTPCARTGGGGWHHYFAHPGARVPNSTGKLAPGLDIRGDGGYVVAPPSVHANGRTYLWSDGGIADPSFVPPSLPSWLLDRVRAPATRTGRKGRAPNRRLTGGTPYGLAAMLREVNDVSRSSEGTRNDRLNRAAFALGQLVAGGELDRNLAEARLLEAGIAAGLTEAEVHRTLRSGIEAGQREPRSAAAPAPTPSGTETSPRRKPLCTDLGNARRLVARHGEDLRHAATLGWFHWDGRRWKRDAAVAAMRFAKSTAESVWGEVRHASTDDERELVTKWAMKSQDARRLAAMLTLASTEEAVALDADDFDADPWLLNVRNGTLDLRTGDLRPHLRKDLLTKLVPVDYDAAATCPAFERFLEEVFLGNRDLVSFVQKACGYALTGSVEEHVMFFLHGEGANGKSTLLDVLLAVLGEYGAPAAPDILLARRGERHPTEIADLRGRRLVSCIEVGQGRGVNEALLKWLTGGDRLKARLMRMDFFEFAPTFKVFLAANHRPRVRETDDGFWRRIRLIPFRAKFRDRPRDATGAPLPGEKDRRLPARLRAEAPGILRWAVEGCLRWQREGLAPPADVERATADYRSGEDALGLFLAECCVIEAGARVGKGYLYETYTAWAKRSGEDALPMREFRKALLDRGLTEERVGRAGTRCWAGIGLLADTPTDADADLGIPAGEALREGENPNPVSASVSASAGMRGEVA